MGLAVLLALFTSTFVGLTVFRRFAARRGLLLDIPNSRSNHVRATVRGAGVVFVLATSLGWAMVALEAPTPYVLPLLAAGLTVAGVSFIDDIRGLPISTRLCAQVAASLLFLSAVPVPSFLQEQLGVVAWLWTPLAAFFMVAVINIYNFMDGADGVCTLHSLGVVAGLVLFCLPNDPMSSETWLCLCLGFPLLAFLIHNWSPARVFMGDVGSTFIGLTFAGMAMIQAPGIFRGMNFLSVILLMFPFLLDATFTLLLRVWRGERWYTSHTSHIFQRLVRTRVSHAIVAGVYGGLTIYMGWMIWLLNRAEPPHPLAVLLLLLLPYLGLYLWLTHREARHEGRRAQIAAQSIPDRA